MLHAASGIVDADALESQVFLSDVDHVLHYHASEEAANIHIVFSGYLGNICNLPKFCKALDHSKHIHILSSLDHIHEVLTS